MEKRARSHLVAAAQWCFCSKPRVATSQVTLREVLTLIFVFFFPFLLDDLNVVFFFLKTKKGLFVLVIEMHMAEAVNICNKFSVFSFPSQQCNVEKLTVFLLRIRAFFCLSIKSLQIRTAICNEFSAFSFFLSAFSTI